MTRDVTTMMALVLALLSWGARVDAGINVRLAPYSAAGNGSTDDTTAIQNAINAAVAAGGAEVYFPAGTYKVNTTLTAYGPVTLRGEGQRTSIIRWEGSPTGYHGIWFESLATGVHHTFTVRGLSLLRHNGTGGAALYTTWKHLGPSPGYTIDYTTGGGVTMVAEDLHISATGWPSASVYWDSGIVIRNGAAAKISTFNIQGGGADNGTAGIQIMGLSNVLGSPGRTVGAAIHDGSITGFHRGIQALNGANEALNAQNIVMRDVHYGFEVLYAGRGTSISNNQIWVRHRGIALYNSLGDVAITNNLIYRQTDQLFFGIEANDDETTAWRYRIIGNYIWSDINTSQPHHGITLVNNVRDTVVESNTTQNMTTGIWIFNSPVTDVNVYGNINRSAGTTISSAGTSVSQANNQ